MPKLDIENSARADLNAENNFYQKNDFDFENHDTQFELER